MFLNIDFDPRPCAREGSHACFGAYVFHTGGVSLDFRIKVFRLKIARENKNRW